MIAYFKGKSMVSKLIRWRTWGIYSHVAWIVNADFKYKSWSTGEIITVPAGTIYESWHRKTKGAARNGLRKGIAGDLHKHGTAIDLYALPINDSHYVALLVAFDRMILDPRAKYDFRAVVFGFMLREKSANSTNKMFCSEFLMSAFITLRGRFLINILPEQTSPMDMAHSPAQVRVGRWKTGTPWTPFVLPAEHN